MSKGYDFDLIIAGLLTEEKGRHIAEAFRQRIEDREGVSLTLIGFEKIAPGAGMPGGGWYASWRSEDIPDVPLSERGFGAVESDLRDLDHACICGAWPDQACRHNWLPCERPQ